MKYFLLLPFLFLFERINAQVTLQGYAGSDGYDFSSFMQKDITANQKLSYFGYTNYFASYSNDSVGSSEIYQVINYQFIKNAGLSVGGTFTAGEFLPQLGLFYSIQTKHFGFNIFPAIGYSFRSNTTNYGLYSLMEYAPKINDFWNFYSMLVLNTDFDANEHTKSNQHIRLGLEYKNKFQLGIGINLDENGNTFEMEKAIGVFAGYNLF